MINYKKNQEDHRKIIEELNELYGRKNRDYGDSFRETFKTLGIMSAVTRLHDKMSRVISLSKNCDRQVKTESLRDTLIDLANYSIMTVMEIDREAEEKSAEKNPYEEAYNDLV